MKCPYLIKQTTITCQGQPKIVEYEAERSDIESTLLVGNDTTEIVIQSHTECLEEECGAWRESFCQHKQ